MTISFVIPAYNEERTIRRCLSSVLRDQKRCGRGVEIIVVDNACTDRTAEIALSMPGVRVVREPRKGLSHARQAGFLASRGELVACIDADTILVPGWIERALRAFQRNPRLSALSGPYFYYDLSRRSALQRIGGYDTSITFYGEETDLACRLIATGHVRFTFRFPIMTSGRRLKKEGVIRTGSSYAINGLAVLIRGRPASHRYSDIRDA